MSNAERAIEAGLGAGGYVSGTLALAASTVDGSSIADWIERVGFAAAASIALFIAGWRLTRWVGTKVVEPLVSRAIATLDKVSAAVDAQAATLERVAASEEKSLVLVSTFAKSLEAVLAGLADNRVRLGRIESAMGLDGPPPDEEEDR